MSRNIEIAQYSGKDPGESCERDGSNKGRWMGGMAGRRYHQQHRQHQQQQRTTLQRFGGSGQSHSDGIRGERWTCLLDPWSQNRRPVPPLAEQQ
ncbi:uncharacterized protein H6S33_012932 [Morchella sextelata]|uniref:uncharacterized protein n=1 Tax=Morchella sextelata TaxID=1174677 RepID=UPI001D044EE4|nr:uncharacterized protein H6S33_012932 [Morchella sextelata]KAH0609446.1 hypothetical protein H6S33_012932 [Morchella sextelata]